MMGAKINIDLRAIGDIVNAVIENLRKWGLEPYGRFYGIYRAEIKEVKDDKLKVAIPEIFGSEEELVEVQKTNFVLPFASKSAGLYFEPKVGDYVWIGFEMGLVSKPYIVGYFWGQKNNEPSTHKFGLVTRSGHKVEFDDENDVITVQNSSGKVKITIKGGDVEVVNEDGTTKLVSKEVHLVNPHEPAVLGETLKNFLTKLIEWLQTHSHAQASPPAPPQIAKLRQIVSEFQNLEKFLSKDVKLK